MTWPQMDPDEENAYTPARAVNAALARMSGDDLVRAYRSKIVLEFMARSDLLHQAVDAASQTELVDQIKAQRYLGSSGRPPLTPARRKNWEIRQRQRE